MAKSFTLIELLIVVAIMGVLAAVGIPTYNNYTENAKLQVHKTQVSQIKNFLNTESAVSGLGGKFFETTLLATSPSATLSVGNLEKYFSDFKDPYDSKNSKFNGHDITAEIHTYTAAAVTSANCSSNTAKGKIGLVFNTGTPAVSLTYCDLEASKPTLVTLEIETLGGNFIAK